MDDRADGAVGERPGRLGARPTAALRSVEATAALQVSLFGALQVTTPSAALSVRGFPGVKPKQLLELLLCERGHRVSKSRLAEQLWGEALPQDHAATLETYVSVLRRTLDPRAGARRSAIVTEHGGYRIGPDGVDVDLDRFDELVGQVADAEPELALARLQQALELVRGEVLEDEPYAPWAQQLRDTYHDRHVQALVDAGRLSLVVGEAPRAMGLAQKAVALSPLAEPAYQVLMTAAYALWRQDEALGAFERCRRLLAEELGADPLDETVALHLAILRHEEVAELMPVIGARVRQSISVVAPVPDELPLLGRERELAQLQEAVTRARTGRLTVALVTGGTGMGKTALVERLAQRCGMPVATNRCSDLESAFPYLALSLAVRTLVPEQGEQGLPAVDRLVERAQPFDQFTRLGVMESFAAQLSGQPGFLLWLDDVQWADPETITTLGYLQRRCADAPIVVVLTCDRSRPTLEALRTLHPDVRVDLGLLSRAEVDGLGQPDLFAVTAGHPLFVDGWLRARRRGLPQQFPPELCERVLMDCWDAGPQGYRLLSVVAALEGPACCPELLAELLDADRLEVVGQLDQLVERGLLAWVDDGVAFCTPALRSVLLAALSPARSAIVRDRAQSLTSGWAADGAPPLAGLLPGA